MGNLVRGDEIRIINVLRIGVIYFRSKTNGFIKWNRIRKRFGKRRGVGEPRKFENPNQVMLVRAKVIAEIVQ